MQSGRLPLESVEEYKSRTEDYLTRLRQATAMIVVCNLKLEECMNILEDEYLLEFPVWGDVFAGLEVIGNKITQYVEEFQKDYA